MLSKHFKIFRTHSFRRFKRSVCLNKGERNLCKNIFHSSRIEKSKVLSYPFFLKRGKTQFYLSPKCHIIYTYKSLVDIMLWYILRSGMCIQNVVMSFMIYSFCGWREFDICIYFSYGPFVYGGNSNLCIFFRRH